MMKVQITPESKKWLTLAEMPAARRIIKEMKEDEYETKELAKDAMNWIINPFGFDTRILECSASICRNSRIHDFYFDGSGKLDVWIEFVAFNESDACWHCGVYLSDIWTVGEVNREEKRQYCFVMKYRRVDE